MQTVAHVRTVGVQQPSVLPPSQVRPFPQGPAPGTGVMTAAHPMPISGIGGGMMSMADAARGIAPGKSLGIPGVYPGVQAQMGQGFAPMHLAAGAADGLGMKRSRDDKDGDGDGDGDGKKSKAAAADAGKKGEDSDDDTRFDVLAIVRRNKTLGEKASSHRSMAALMLYPSRV